MNLDNYQIVHLRPGPDVSVNEKPLRLAEETAVEITDEAGTVLVHVQAAEWPEQLISMNMPAHGLHVIYTGSKTLIMVSPLCIMLQNLLSAQHVSGTIMSNIRSSRILYSGYLSGLQDAAASCKPDT